jgi:large subunit ribosomal protein L25
VTLKGEPKGVKQQGGLLDFVTREIQVQCLPTEIPEHIDIDVSEMKLDDVLHIKELKLPPGVKALQDEDLVVAQVKTIEEEAAAPAAEEGAAEPEVIGRKPEEGEEAAAAGAEEKK